MKRLKLGITLPPDVVRALSRLQFYEGRSLSDLVEEAVGGLLVTRRSESTRVQGRDGVWILKPSGEDYPPLPEVTE